MKVATPSRGAAWTGVSGGEFAHALAAGAARVKSLRPRRDQDGGDAPVAGRDHRGDRPGLRAGAHRIGGIFDVAADMERPAARGWPRRRGSVNRARWPVAHRPRRLEQGCEPAPILP